MIRALFFLFATSALSAAPHPQKGERIALIGNGLAERMLYFGHFETELHLRYPEKNLVVRNMARPGDTAGYRPHPGRKSAWAFPGAGKFNPQTRTHNGRGFFPTPDEWLTMAKADTIIGFFGYNESFAGEKGIKRFTRELEAFAKHTRSQKYNGKTTPRLVLVSPIPISNNHLSLDLPDPRLENERIAKYAEATRAVAKKFNLTHIDLFEKARLPFTESSLPVSHNGFLPSDHGYRLLAPILADGLYGTKDTRSKTPPGLMREAVLEKDWFWANDYRQLNGVHAYGQRYEPYGPGNYPDETRKTRDMLALRQARLHEIAQGKSTSLEFDDSKTHTLPPVETNFPKDVELYTPEESIAKMTVMDGFEVKLFAAESDFPDMKNPVQMTFDTRGRLWVAVMPSYPHYRPGDPRPNDKLLILEDTDRDGKADKQTVFADGLHLPIGFEITPDGVYLSQEPNLCLLIDEDGDDKADRTEILLHGFDTHDTHHAISAFAADASGSFYMCEGRFLHSQVETPYGPGRCTDGGVWRFDPKKMHLERAVQTDLANPWAVAFDDWDQCFISDASYGKNWWTLPISAKTPHGKELTKVEQFAPKYARPTSGGEFVSSRHFPDELQGHFMVNNTIGFLGTSLHDVWEDGAGFSGQHVGNLVSSKDPNFRPVDLEFAPDGSLYFDDWYNPLIGHMQHSARDPKRDYDHGRIYRITHKTRPLVEPAKIHGATIPELLENLKLPEYRSRYRTRTELRSKPAEEVLAAVKTWVAGLDQNDPRYEHHLCEALWATWSHNKVDVGLWKKCFSAGAHQARAAAVHVLRYAQRDIPGAIGHFMKAANDPHGRVRLEAIVAASWMGEAAGTPIVLAAIEHPLDRWMATVTEEIFKLRFRNNPVARDIIAKKRTLIPARETEATYGPTRKLTSAEKKIYDLGKEVFHRDAHCATCHQADGKGVAKIYPPLEKSNWVDDNDERTIKLILKGLWGPIEVNGTEYDPKNGVPPMMGFAPLLNDEEIAAVINYVRTSFGNDQPFVSKDTVKVIREETRERANFYMVDELLSEHPLE